MDSLLFAGGAYASFAGHDASRALAMFQTDLVKDEHDDLSDLNSVQMDSVREWEAQLAGRVSIYIIELECLILGLIPSLVL